MKCEKTKQNKTKQKNNNKQTNKQNKTKQNKTKQKQNKNKQKQTKKQQQQQQLCETSHYKLLKLVTNFALKRANMHAVFNTYHLFVLSKLFYTV